MKKKIGNVIASSINKINSVKQYSDNKRLENIALEGFENNTRLVADYMHDFFLPT